MGEGELLPLFFPAGTALPHFCFQVPSHAAVRARSCQCNACASLLERQPCGLVIDHRDGSRAVPGGLRAPCCSERWGALECGGRVRGTLGAEWVGPEGPTPLRGPMAPPASTSQVRGTDGRWEQGCGEGTFKVGAVLQQGAALALARPLLWGAVVWPLARLRPCNVNVLARTMTLHKISQHSHAILRLHQVMEYLVSNGYLLTALELFMEACEAGREGEVRALGTLRTGGP